MMHHDAISASVKPCFAVVGAGEEGMCLGGEGKVLGTEGKVSISGFVVVRGW